MSIEENSDVAAVTPRIERHAADFKGHVFMSQNFPISSAQIRYLGELGWLFPVDKLNYYQADWLRKRLEENFPERIRPFRDSDNPWSPGSTRPMNVEPANVTQRSYLEFLGVDCDESVTADKADILIANKGSKEKFSEWKTIRDSWKNLPPTDRQLQVLRFFKCLPHQMADRGAANATIVQIFRSDANRQEWEEYKRNEAVRMDDQG